MVLETQSVLGVFSTIKYFLIFDLLVEILIKCFFNSQNIWNYAIFVNYRPDCPKITISVSIASASLKQCLKESGEVLRALKIMRTTKADFFQK